MALNLVPQFRRKLQVLTASTAVVVSTLRHDAIDAAACLERRLQSVTPSTRGRHRTHLHHVAGMGVLVVEERPGAGLPRHHTPRVSALLIRTKAQHTADADRTHSKGQSLFLSTSSRSSLSAPMRHCPSFPGGTRVRAMAARAGERPVNANAKLHRTSLLRPNAKAAGYNFGAIGQFVHLDD
jgi:hypothetical protein